MRMKNVLKKFFGGGSALALSIVMAIGVFAGLGIEARAAKTIDKTMVTLDTWTSLGTSVEIGTECTVNYQIEGYGSNSFRSSIFYVSEDVDTTSLTDINFFNYYVLQSKDNSILKREINPNPNPNFIFNVETFDNITNWDIEAALLSGDDYYYFVVLLTPAKSGTSGTPSASELNASSHTHSYSWVTVKEASIGEDGLEEYVCSCGDVQERSTIPASAAIVNGFCNAVKNAPINGIAEYDSGWWYTMSDYFIRELAKRSDVITVVTFEYERQMYKMTIPSGVDYTALLADEDYFYGYFYFANAVGATIETIKTAQ